MLPRRTPLLPGGRNFPIIRRRNEHFRRRDAVIRQVGTTFSLSPTAGSLHGFRNLIDSKMMFFAVIAPAPPSRQTGIRAVRGRPQDLFFVQRQNMQQIQMLTLYSCRRLI